MIKIDKDNPLGIKHKRDWFIACAFTFLVVYAISTRFSQKVDDWLFNFTPDFFTNMNQLRSYGNWLITIAVMAVIVEAVLLLYRKIWKVKLWVFGGVFATAVVLWMGVFFGYQLHSRLVVSVIDTEQPVSFGINSCLDSREVYIQGTSLTEEETEQLIELCKSLQPVDEAKQEELYQAYKDSDGDWFMNAEEISFRYPVKYGHDFHFNIRIYDGNIFVRKGYNEKQKELIVFFEDNGLLQMVEELKEKYGAN